MSGRRATDTKRLRIQALEVRDRMFALRSQLRRYHQLTDIVGAALKALLDGSDNGLVRNYANEYAGLQSFVQRHNIRLMELKPGPRIAPHLLRHNPPKTDTSYRSNSPRGPLPHRTAPGS